MKRTLIVAGTILIAACSRHNNLLMGRVEANVGSHTVVVTDCYRTSVPDPRRLPDENGAAVWRYTPCKDADVLIKAEQLTVNGREYGRLNPADGVLVDHGVISIQHKGAAAQSIPPAAAPPVTISKFFVRSPLVRVRQTKPWRATSRRIKRCTSWTKRFFSALSTSPESPA
jgi:hypothetical protein